LRVYGEKGSLAWSQENPNYLIFTALQQQPRMITRGGPGVGAAATHATRIPSGHPEGYFEAFAQLYKDIADQIAARIQKEDAPTASCLVPGVSDGVEGMRFIEAVLRSSKDGSAWTSLHR
jgi:predicted dehydrogenase